MLRQSSTLTNERSSVTNPVLVSEIGVVTMVWNGGVVGVIVGVLCVVIFDRGGRDKMRHATIIFKLGGWINHFMQLLHLHRIPFITYNGGYINVSYIVRMHICIIDTLDFR